jgi:NADH-dependent peroxiredoxin subunit C
MSLINTEIKPFTATAFHNGEFVDRERRGPAGKWSSCSSTRPTSPSSARPSSATWPTTTRSSRRLGVEIYSVSTDTHFTHKAWHDTSDTIGKIQYPMIGDPTGEITRNFEVMREGQGLADRGTFVIDPDGVIQFMEITAEGIGRNAAELLRKVKAAQYVRKHPGEVCPAKWEEGDDTLAPSLDLVGKI